MYEPGAGFYAAGGGASQAASQADFLTSPELGPLFGAVLARAIDGWWHELGGPDPFFVVEAAAGVGTLARAVLDARPECAPALRYLLVERAEPLRRRQEAVLAVEPASSVVGAVARADDEDDDGPAALPGQGPRVASLEDLPVGPFPGVVFANELLDNLPFGLLERADDGWREVRVAESDDGASLVEVLTPPSPADAEWAGRLAPDAKAGARIPVQHRGSEWLRRALRTLSSGRVVLVDYGATTAELADRPHDEWIRTYRAGGRGRPPLEVPGAQDITCDVCVDQLARVAAPDRDRSQAEFLADSGLDALVADARARWEAGAAAPDLAALAARSRVGEAATLRDPSGMGAFRVLEWRVDAAG